jgi:dihydrofolate synthase / folylpolyglutamate synthase
MESNYRTALNFLYSQLPVYHQIGAKAYKKDLTNTIALCDGLGNPQTKFKTIHVTGTNGKGSSSHMLAAILQSAGYKTGLYTSPHLKDFSERIKINGREIDHQFVTDFVNQMKPAMAEIQPSFFELTVAMAFEYFARNKVDIAVIEVGLGGRLDSTNIIQPEISLITNIGYDHMDILGDTLAAIAFEKAGIIKPNTPVIISERQPEIDSVFDNQAKEKEAPIQYASDTIFCTRTSDGELLVKSNTFNGRMMPELKGSYQTKNICGVIATVIKMIESGWKISSTDIMNGINNTVTLTGLKGRWQILQQNPLVVCDTGHNAEGIHELIEQIKQTPHATLHWVIGMVKDKSPEKVLSILPKHARYYFCQAKIERALDANELLRLATERGLTGVAIADVNAALSMALRASKPEDMVMVGGSTFVVAEVDGL